MSNTAVPRSALFWCNHRKCDSFLTRPFVDPENTTTKTSGDDVSPEAGCDPFWSVTRKDVEAGIGDYKILFIAEFVIIRVLVPNRGGEVNHGVHADTDEVF